MPQNNCRPEIPVSTPPMLQVTDIVLAPGQGSVRDLFRTRVAGFWQEARRGETRLFLPCRPEDPGLALVSSYSMCGLFHRPWDLMYAGPVRWDPEHIACEQESWARYVETGELCLSSRDQPELFSRFPPLSRHDAVRIAGWRADISRAIRIEQAGVQP